MLLKRTSTPHLAKTHASNIPKRKKKTKWSIKRLQRAVKGCILMLALISLLLFTVLFGLIKQSNELSSTYMSATSIHTSHRGLAINTTRCPPYNGQNRARERHNETSGLLRGQKTVHPNMDREVLGDKPVPIHEKSEAANGTNKEDHQKGLPHPHPHAGARYPDGQWGYVADVTRVRQWMLDRYRREQSSSQSVTALPLSYVPADSFHNSTGICDLRPGSNKGSEGNGGWKVIQKVKIDAPPPEPWPAEHYVVTNFTPPHDLKSEESERFIPSNPYGVSKGKLLCSVYTHAGAKERVTAITETWGHRCDGFFAASTVTIDDPSQEGFGSIDLPHLGKEEYANMWMKTRSILSYMYDNYFDEFDYFYLCGDDTHLIVENLKRYLYVVEQRYNATIEPLFIGEKITPLNDINGGNPINAGGAGYILNKVALKRLVEEQFPVCLTDEVSPREDVLVSRCLKEIGIEPIDTCDARGEQRFHGPSPDGMFTIKGQNEYWGNIYRAWAEDHGFKRGKELVSVQSTAFHWLRTPQQMRRHHVLLYNSCPIGSVVGDALQKRSNIQSSLAKKKAKLSEMHRSTAGL